MTPVAGDSADFDRRVRRHIMLPAVDPAQRQAEWALAVAKERAVDATGAVEAAELAAASVRRTVRRDRVRQVLRRLDEGMAQVAKRLEDVGVEGVGGIQAAGGEGPIGKLLGRLSSGLIGPGELERIADPKASYGEVKGLQFELDFNKEALDGLEIDLLGHVATLTRVVAALVRKLEVGR